MHDRRSVTFQQFYMNRGNCEDLYAYSRTYMKDTSMTAYSTVAIYGGEMLVVSPACVWWWWSGATIFISVTATPWKWEPFLPDASTTCTYALSSRFPFVCVSSLFPFLYFPLFFRGFRIWVVEHQRTKIDSWLELRVSVVGVRTKETDEALIVPPHILRRQFFSFNFVHCTTLIVQCNSPAMSNVNE